MPIGVSDFKELVSEYYYVDKTLMLKEFIDSKPKVSLFTRPRRFGKTLAMDMLKTFFEVSDTDTSKYFKKEILSALTNVISQSTAISIQQAIMNNLYHVDSNRESGHGRYDIQLRPYDKKMPGIIIELKVLRDGINESRIDSELEASAREALAQIDRQQ